MGLELIENKPLLDEIIEEHTHIKAVMNNKVNGPFLTLSDLYNDDIVYTSRPSYVSNPWLKPDEHQSNFLTGRELLIANRFPVIVHEASVTNKLEQLLI